MARGRPKQRKFKHLDQAQRGRIIGLREIGASFRNIGQIVKCDDETARRIWKKWKKTNSLSNLPKAGRPRKTTPREDRHIFRKTIEDSRTNAVAISKDLKVELGQKLCSVTTIKRRLKEKGLNGRVARKKPLINENQKASRLRWAQTYCDWQVEDWKNVEFSDESPYTLFPRCGKKWIWRPKGEAFNPKYLVRTVKHGGGKIQVWGSFSWYGVGELYWIQGKLTGAKYREILKNHLAPRLRALMKEHKVTITFQHDNDPKHTSNVVKNYLNNAGFQVLEWASQSADLNPIENLWNQVKDQLEARKDRPSSLPDLFDKVQEEWKKIPLSFIQNLIVSMPRRCKAVLESQGETTKY